MFAYEENNRGSGEYIEDCGEIKTETPESRQSTVPFTPQMLLTRNFEQRDSQTNLTSLQLIHQLNHFANRNRNELQSKASKRRCGTARAHNLPSEDPDTPASLLQPGINHILNSGLPSSSETNNNASKVESGRPDSLELPEPGGQQNKSMIDCPVCGDIAVAHFHYGGMCCYSCKAFFRRVVNTNKVRLLIIPRSFFETMP